MTELSAEIRRAMNNAFWNGFLSCAVLVMVAGAIVGILMVITGQPL